MRTMAPGRRRGEAAGVWSLLYPELTGMSAPLARVDISVGVSVRSGSAGRIRVAGT
jgi:hypothetical protein